MERNVYGKAKNDKQKYNVGRMQNQTAPMELV